jgi:hypothetical protein
MSLLMTPRASLSCRSWQTNARKAPVAFLQAAVAYYAKLGLRVERLPRTAPIFTRPYTPKTNGKAQRFIQTALREWARA